MMYPLVSELAADGIPVVVSCRVLKLARQPYYRWLRDPVTSRELEEAYRANALFDAHRDDPEFGYRLLADEAREEGQAMSDRTAWRIASSNGWWSVFGKKRSKNGKKPGPAVHDDLCVVIDEHGRERHRFVASRPNQLWLTDITEHHTQEGRLYLCAVKDAFSGRIVGYSIDARMKASLAVRAVRNASGFAGAWLGASCIRTVRLLLLVFSGVLTLTARGARGCRCRVFSGVPDSHSDRHRVVFPRICRSPENTRRGVTPRRRSDLRRACANRCSSLSCPPVWWSAVPSPPMRTDRSTT